MKPNPNINTMPHFPSPIAGFLSLSVQTLEDAERYYREVQGEYYRGLPGVPISAGCFSTLSCELVSFRLKHPYEYAQLWLLDMPNGGTFVTTSLHQAKPGVALSEFLQGRHLPDELARFLAQWRELVGAFYALGLLYVSPNPEEQPPHAKGQN